MSELVKRALFGAIYVAIVLAAVNFHPLGLLVFVVVIYVAGLTELKHLIGGAENKTLFTTATVLGVLALWAHTSFSMDFQNHFLAFYGLVVFGTFIHFIFLTKSTNSSTPVLQVAFSMSYVLIPLALAVSIAFARGFWEPKYLLALFFFLWSNDTFAYLTGRAIGKHKLIERVSPKKTIEGLIGGIIGALIVGYVLSLLWSDLSLLQWLIFALLVAVSGTMGDLFESALKRSANVKDAGNVIPGHGGILDRLDSFLFAVPISYFYLHFFA
jgi:phosphatidate cytidylyltransferase